MAYALRPFDASLCIDVVKTLKLIPQSSLEIFFAHCRSAIEKACKGRNAPKPVGRLRAECDKGFVEIAIFVPALEVTAFKYGKQAKRHCRFSANAWKSVGANKRCEIGGNALFADSPCCGSKAVTCACFIGTQTGPQRHGSFCTAVRQVAASDQVCR